MRTMGAGYACWLSSSWRSTERQEENGGGWGDCNCATTFSPKFDARLGQRRRAAISATQKRVGLLSSSSSESQATCVFCRCAQTESSVVLPQPAEAESRVSGVESASSSAVSKRSRSTRAFGKRGGVSVLESSIPCASDDGVPGSGAKEERSGRFVKICASCSKRAKVTWFERPR